MERRVYTHPVSQTVTVLFSRSAHAPTANSRTAPTTVTVSLPASKPLPARPPHSGLRRRQRVLQGDSVAARRPTRVLQLGEKHAGCKRLLHRRRHW
eukprot:1661306-Prymnesium_polylepis.2